MGTHPIFESDFDCLTDWAKRRITPPGSTTRTVSSTPFQSLTGSTTVQLVGPAFMIYSATKESVIISVLSQAIEFAALAARECSQIFDSGRKYPDTCSDHTPSEYLYDHLKKLNWVYRRRKKEINMSKSYNVNREVNDAFYRYKMPAIVAKVEGNGIKTVIVNMVDIARALNREAIYPTKFFGIELGAQTHIDAVNERFIVNGSHDEIKLQEILDAYIKKFVLCQACANSETRLQVKKSSIFEICQACGYKGELRSISHSLSNFIIKQHKIEKQGGKKKAKDGEKRKEETKDIYAKDRIKDQKVKVRGDEWGGEDGWDSDSDDDLADQTKKMALSEMKPENMNA